MRKSEAEQMEILEKKGRSPVFGTFDSNGRRIHFTQVGNDTLPLVIVVHGSPGSSGEVLDYLWDTALTKVAQVVAVDRPGYGWSGFGDAEPSLEKQAGALLPILQKFRNKRAILVGHSYGGPVIVKAAIDFPGLVDGLVMVAGSIDPDLEPNNWWQTPLDWKTLRWMLPPALRVSNQEIIPLQEELEAMKPDWGKITCPVTVIQGMKDNLVPPGNAGFADKMLTNSAFKNIKMLEGKGHFIFWTDKEMIVGEVLKLLGGGH